MTIEYYECYDSDNLYAVADTGFFMMFADNRHAGPWRFLPPSSEDYDYHHQKIFRQFKTRLLERSELPDDLPPLPPPPKGPFPSWSQAQGKGRLFAAGEYPHLAALAARADTTGIPVYVVLCEEHYESMFGDGKSLDLDGAFLHQEKAEGRIAEWAHNRMETRSLRQLTIRCVDGRLNSPDYDPGRYEHYQLGEVLARLERQLEAEHGDELPSDGWDSAK